MGICEAAGIQSAEGHGSGEAELSLNQIARWVECHARSVMQWRDRMRREWPQGLTVRPTPGRPPRLSRSQKQRLVRQLLKGPTLFGYETQIWATKLIAELISTAGVSVSDRGRLIALAG